MRGTRRNQKEISRAQSGNDPMNRLLLTVALTVMMGGAFYVTSTVAQLSPTTKKSCKRRDHPGPEIEPANSYLTIVRWTINNPGGLPHHYGVVHYGTDPKGP